MVSEHRRIIVSERITHLHVSWTRNPLTSILDPLLIHRHQYITKLVTCCPKPFHSVPSKETVGVLLLTLRWQTLHYFRAWLKRAEQKYGIRTRLMRRTRHSGGKYLITKDETLKLELRHTDCTRLSQVCRSDHGVTSPSRSPPDATC